MEELLHNGKFKVAIREIQKGMSKYPTYYKYYQLMSAVYECLEEWILFLSTRQRQFNMVTYYVNNYFKKKRGDDDEKKASLEKVVLTDIKKIYMLYVYVYIFKNTLDFTSERIDIAATIEI
ncbi:hypothetical protein RFI_38762 [Reticulomyxa filosa]|uniref:Uncharacterized protein n=1 Tax=Reticulomyxa filosa TaxID=46433 RepID=X6LBG3_RETFI|nr:hypothetical protein RFI_38762 [Reticulomyxa filosa]|eukprot:ETN98720.1 hypothetical protein RFI_38762 [Reticulomyxa filosa]